MDPNLHPSVSNMLSAADFRTFLANALKYAYRSKRRINLTEFSRRAGFRSRSYISELMSGKKGISAIALRKIKTALNLPRDLEKMFDLHSFKEFPQIAPAGLNLDKIVELLEVRRKNWNSKSLLLQKFEDDDEHFFLSERSRIIHASLGDNGATFSEIVMRSRLSDDFVASELKHLTEANLITERDGRYYSFVDDVDLAKLKPNKGFKHLMGDAIHSIEQQYSELVKDPSNFFYLVVLTDSKKSEEFKARMNQAIIDVIEEYQVSDGDEIRKIFLSLT